MVSADIETPSWRLSPSPSLGLARGYAGSNGKTASRAHPLGCRCQSLHSSRKGSPAGEKYLVEEEKKRTRPFWLPLSCSSSALMTEWSPAAAVASARAKPEKT